MSNVLWGFGNLVAGALLLHRFWPWGGMVWAGWLAFGFGALVMAVQLASHFGKVRAERS